MPVLQVNKGYFGISRRLVTHVKIQCGQCDEARKKENKAPIRPMIVTRALQKMEVTHLRLELQSALFLVSRLTSSICTTLPPGGSSTSCRARTTSPSGRSWRRFSTNLVSCSQISLIHAFFVAAEVLTAVKKHLGSLAPMIDHFQSDNGGEFVDAEEWAKSKGIRWIHTRPKHPQADGLVESANNTAQQELHKLMATHKKKLWHTLLEEVMGELCTHSSALRALSHMRLARHCLVNINARDATATGKTPMEMLFGQGPRPLWDREGAATSGSDAKEERGAGRTQPDADVQLLAARRVASLGSAAEKLLSDEGCPQLERRGVPQGCPIFAVLLAADLPLDVEASGEEVPFSSVTRKAQQQQAKALVGKRLRASLTEELLQDLEISSTVQVMQRELELGTQLRQRHLKVLAAALSLNVFLLETRQTTIDEDTSATVSVLAMGPFKHQQQSLCLHALTTLEQASAEGDGEMQADEAVAETSYELLQRRTDASRLWDCKNEIVRVI